MTATMELYDGSTTIDLLGSIYNASLPLELAPAPASAVYAGRVLRGVTREPRTVRVRLTVKGSTVSDLETKLRDLEGMLATAERRQSSGYGTMVVLKCQLSNTDAEDVEYRVMWGELEVPSTALNEPVLSSSFAAPGAVLHLVCEPFGRLGSVSVSADTLENEQDSTLVNYMDIQNITGTKSALMQLKIHDSNNGGGNAWNGSKKMWIAKRSGERRTDGLFFQGEAADNTIAGTSPMGGNSSFSAVSSAAHSATTSAGASLLATWQKDTQTDANTTAWRDCFYAQFDIAGASIPDGLFRVLARVRITSDNSGTPGVGEDDMGFALGWSFGGSSKAPVDGDEVRPPDLTDYHTLDLGELALPPTNVPDGFAAPTFGLRIHGTCKDADGTSMASGQDINWYIDYVLLLPIDEGAAIMDAVSTSDRILIDNVSETPGVYLLNGSDVIQKFATFTGGPFDLGPEDTRVLVVRDDTGDPSNVQFTLTPTYIPRVGGL